MKETKSLEFKESISRTYLKTVSAFANFGDGEILFGVADNGDIVGVSDADKKRIDIENTINDSIHPRPRFTLKVDTKKNIIHLKVFEGAEKPYLYNGKAYRRSDTATVEVDDVEFRRLTLAGSHLRYEELPYSGELDFTDLSKRLRDTLGLKEVDGDTFRTLGFYTTEKQWNNAAALLSDSNSFAGIDMARFGASSSIILDRERKEACSVLMQYDAALLLFQKYYELEKIEGSKRINVELVPETAFREALANALVHREWDVNTPIRIAMYEDRVEIVSPGGLPHGITKDEYLRGNISNLRNPILANVLFRLGYIEMFGTGIGRIVEAYSRAESKPGFEVYDNSIVVSLPLIEPKKRLTSDEDAIYSLLLKEAELSSSEIAERAGFGKNKVLRVMASLEEKRYIAKIGSGRGTKYERL